MKLQLNATAVLAVAGLAGVAFLVWKGPSLVKGAANAVNPFNHDNVFATGVNGVGEAIFTDPEDPGKNADGSWSLGGWLYDITHGDAGKVATGREPASQPLQPLGETPDGHLYDAMGNQIY